MVVEARDRIGGHAKAFGTVDGDDGLYDFTNLALALRRRKPWLALPR